MLIWPKKVEHELRKYTTFFEIIYRNEKINNY